MSDPQGLRDFPHRHMTIGVDNKLAIPNNGPRRLDMRADRVEVAPRLLTQTVLQREGPLARPLQFDHMGTRPRLPCQIVDECSDVRPARALDIKTEERER